MSNQLEMFELPKNLIGEEAWKLAKAVAMGDYELSTAMGMVKDKSKLYEDLEYIDSICQQYTY